jgi:hypothetical protein
MCKSLERRSQLAVLQNVPARVKTPKVSVHHIFDWKKKHGLQLVAPKYTHKSQNP